MFNLLQNTALLSKEDGYTVLLGIGIVFVGLIFLILCCYIMGFIAKKNSTTKEASVATPAQTAVQSAPVIENKQELVAAISAAVAENLGKDVSAIRITSIKRV